MRKLRLAVILVSAVVAVTATSPPAATEGEGEIAEGEGEGEGEGECVGFGCNIADQVCVLAETCAQVEDPVQDCIRGKADAGEEVIECLEVTCAATSDPAYACMLQNGTCVDGVWDSGDTCNDLINDFLACFDEFCDAPGQYDSSGF